MNDCVFCRIIRGEIPAQKTYEDERFLAFLDINPKSPGHTLLVPKEHYQWFYDLPDELYDALFRTARMLALKLKAERGADYVQLSIIGKDVPHAHVHLIPRMLGASVPM
jgi:histidine triad (HIT) family protein